MTKSDTKRCRILLFSFHYPPDQSAGAHRSQALVKALADEDQQAIIWVFSSTPRRYGIRKFCSGQGLKSFNSATSSASIRIKRFWVPFFGNGPLSSAIAYVFYMLQTIPAALLVRPEIVIGTSAKLLTSFVAACSAKLTGASLYIDFRDTFADNYFYFYRWHKRIILQSIIMIIENIVLRCATSINMVSVGFEDAFHGWDRILQKYHISVTNFPNGIENGTRQQIEDATRNKKIVDDSYSIVYAGNLGEGQDMVSLLKSIARNPKVIDELNEQKVRIQIYGAGAHSEIIERLTADGIEILPKGSLAGLVFYKGLVPNEEMASIYKEADCLMLQLGLYNSLSMVIPSKIFEYASTPFPIIFGASGFAYEFINQINGCISFKQGNAKSFLDAVKLSRITKPDLKSRSDFLDKYNRENISSSFAKHILYSNFNKSKQV